MDFCLSYYTFYDSPLGPLLLTADAEALTGLWFQGTSPSSGLQDDTLPVFGQTRDWLNCYFNGGIPDFTPPIHLSGTPFRLEVWELLRHIPYGKTLSYGDLARQVAARHGIARMSAQAVGGAVGHNPISIIIPCHRVIGSDGQLVGYGGGLTIKSKLLDLEREHHEHSVIES